MQKNNNKVFIKIIGTGFHALLAWTLVFFFTCVSSVSHAQRVSVEDDLTLQIDALQDQLIALTEESLVSDSQINSQQAVVQGLQLDLDSTNSEYADLQTQLGSLLAEISTIDAEIPALDSQRGNVNIEIAQLVQSNSQLLQSRLDVVSETSSKLADLNVDLVLAQENLNRVQTLGSDLMAQLDTRIEILGQYLLIVKSKRLRAYIETYISLISIIRDRYFSLIESSKATYAQKIIQAQEEIGQVNTESVLILAAIDQEMSGIDDTILSKKDEAVSLLNLAVALNDERTNLVIDLNTVEASIASSENLATQLADDLQAAILESAELEESNVELLNQIETLLIELTTLVELHEQQLLEDASEQNIANAIATLNNLETSDSGRCQANDPDVIAIACFESDKQQIVRLSHSQFLSLGVDLTGVPKQNIGALNNKGAVPLFVSADELFDESSFIEIVTGEREESIYSDNMTYLIYVDFDKEFSLSATSHDLSDTLGSNILSQQNGSLTYTSIDTNDTNLVSNAYTEELHYEKDDYYNISGLSDFGWTDANGFHYLFAGQSQTIDAVFELDSTAQLDEYANISVQYSEFASSSDSLYSTVYLNGIALDRPRINQPGITNIVLDLEIAPGILQLGENTLSLSAQNAGRGRVSFQFDEFTLAYQRRLMDKEGAIVFTAKSGQHHFSGFSNDTAMDVVVFKQSDAGQVERIAPFESVNSNEIQSELAFGKTTFVQPQDATNEFILEATADTIFSVDKVNSDVELTMPRNFQDILSPVAEYLIISHTDFIGTQAMIDLVNLRATEYSVQVVDVDQIYAQYSQGVFDAQAIKQFIGDKMNQSSTEMVLLVGDDTYDYKNRLNMGEQSFIPSMYLTYPVVMAADSVYVDQDNDLIPDIAIGRFPVETVDEFSNMVEKTILFHQKQYPQKALLATNYLDGIGATHFHPFLKNSFRDTWELSDILMPEDTIAAREIATATLADLINEDSGSGLMVYTGHNSYATGPMFTSFDIPLLANQGNPISAVMIDSFTGFYIADQFTAAIGVQAEDLLVAQGVGAAAVFAPSSTVGLQNVQTRFISQISRDQRYGDAYLHAMQVSANLGSASYNLLGDPGLRLSTF